MAKKTTLTGYRVSVFFPTGGFGNPKRDANECADLIKKHVGCDLHEAKSADVEQIDFEGCQHCGREWTEEDDNYNGGCCAKDQAAEDQRLADEAIEEARKLAPTAGQVVYENRDSGPPPPPPPPHGEHF